MMEIDQLNSSPNLKSPRRDNLDSASKRICSSPSLYNTLLAPTKIANTLSTLSNKIKITKQLKEPVAFVA
jgi:hypothetical protein